MPRPSYAQSVYLTEYMERHPQLARGRLQNADAREKANVLWRTLTLELNSMGGCIKDVATWKKYWNDKKANVKKNSAARYKSMSKTGGGVDKLPEPSEIELKILSIMGSEFGTGLKGIAVPPFQSQLTEGGCTAGTPTTTIMAPVAMQSENEGDGQPEDSSFVEIVIPFGNYSSIPDDTVPYADYAADPVHTAENRPNTAENRPNTAENQPNTAEEQPNIAVDEPNIAEDVQQPDTVPARRSRFRSALGFAREHLAAMEERRIDGQDRLARGVQEICAHLIATRNEASEVAQAQIAAARAQQEAAEAQGRVARDLAEAVKALMEAIRGAR